MEDKFISTDMMEEIRKIYTPLVLKPILAPRAYYDPETMKLICFSQEELDMPWLPIDQSTLTAGIVDLFYIKDNKVLPYGVFDLLKNRLRKGSTYATMKDNIEFAVPTDWAGEKDYWDANS